MMGFIKASLFRAEDKIRKFFAKENGEVNIVVIVVLIGIAVLLAILFKDEISKLLKNMFQTIGDNAGGVVSDPV
jgi:uncharacterized membrane protein YqhA